MSTSTHARHAAPARTTTVPRPRSSAEPTTRQTAERPAPPPEEPVGLFGRHAWLVPVTGVACVLAIFVAMVLLSWVAGGSTPFDR